MRHALVAEFPETMTIVHQSAANKAACQLVHVLAVMDLREAVLESQRSSLMQWVLIIFGTGGRNQTGPSVAIANRGAACTGVLTVHEGIEFGGSSFSALTACIANSFGVGISQLSGQTINASFELCVVSFDAAADLDARVPHVVEEVLDKGSRLDARRDECNVTTIRRKPKPHVTQSRCSLMESMLSQVTSQDVL